MNYIIFGGSGFIGTHLIHMLNDECVKEGDHIYDLDIVMPGEEGVVPGIVEKNKGVEYIRLDVRKPGGYRHRGVHYSKPYVLRSAVVLC